MGGAFKTVTILGMALVSVAGPNARDMSSMYDRVTLERLVPRYKASTNRILNDFAFRYLNAEEKRRLAGVSIDFPCCEAGGEKKDNPLDFSSSSLPGQPRVVFPIFSMKFLEDLSTAYAWLQRKGYVLDTISEYTAMLAHKDLQGRYPAPLPALHIPADALQDKKIDELTRDHFVTARMFILLHELGHVYYGHKKQKDAQQSIGQEIQADKFAIDVIRRSPVTPLGILVFFMADASMAEYPPRARTHPLSGSRLQALAANTEDPQIAAVMHRLGDFLDDADTRAAAILAAKATDENSLAPRRSHLPALHGPARGSVSFQGKYSCQFAYRTDPGNPIAMEMVLQRTGNDVRGSYTFGLGTATLQGTVSGATLSLEWEWGNYYGRSVLNATDNGARLSGSWGYRDSNRDGGTWSCQRQD